MLTPEDDDEVEDKPCAEPEEAAIYRLHRWCRLGCHGVISLTKYRRTGTSAPLKILPERGQLISSFYRTPLVARTFRTLHTPHFPAKQRF